MHSSLQVAQVAPPGYEPPRRTPAGAELAQQFFARPFGPHGVALQHLLNQMRAAPVAHKLVLLVETPHLRWRLARLPAQRGGELALLPDAEFTVLADAERAAFRLRWREMFGQDLPDTVIADG